MLSCRICGDIYDDKFDPVPSSEDAPKICRRCLNTIRDTYNMCFKPVSERNIKEQEKQIEALKRELACQKFLKEFEIVMQKFIDQL